MQLEACEADFWFIFSMKVKNAAKIKVEPWKTFRAKLAKSRKMFSTLIHSSQMAKVSMNLKIRRKNVVRCNFYSSFAWIFSIDDHLVSAFLQCYLQHSFIKFLYNNLKIRMMNSVFFLWNFIYLQSFSKETPLFLIITHLESIYTKQNVKFVDIVSLNLFDSNHFLQNKRIIACWNDCCKKRKIPQIVFQRAIRWFIPKEKSNEENKSMCVI